MDTRNICIKVNDNNITWVIEKQRKGLEGTFKDVLSSAFNRGELKNIFTNDELKRFFKNEMVKLWIKKATQTKLYKIINLNKISIGGLYKDAKGEVWLSLGTVDDLHEEINAEIKNYIKIQEQRKLMTGQWAMTQKKSAYGFLMAELH